MDAQFRQEDAEAVSRHPSLEGYTVLVVDDNQDDLELARRVLECETLRVVTAPSAGRARSLISLVNPHLLIVDLMMPGEDGYQLIRFLRSQPNHRTIPIVVLSGLDSFDARSRCYALGVDCYLSKPVDYHFLADNVRGLLEKRWVSKTDPQVP